MSILATLRAASAPGFKVSPPAIYFHANAGGAAPAVQVAVLNNSVANSTLKWRASFSGSGASYCKASPSQGTLAGQSGAMLSVSASLPANAGGYICTLTLADNGSSPPATNTATVSINLAVYPAGTTLPPPDSTPPNAPDYLGAVATGLNTVSLTWYNGGDPNSYVAGYQVFRDGQQIGFTGLSSFQDSGLATTSYHTYTVAAFDASQNLSSQAPAIAVTTFAAAPRSVPSAYQSLYQGFVSNMATDGVLMNAQWGGVKYPVSYSSSLMSADVNGGARTSFTDLSGVDQELNAVQSIGMNAVMVELGFPILDQNFWEFQGQTAAQAQQTVQNYLSFYELVAQDVHGRKDASGKPMQLIIEANPLLTADNPGTNLDATAYYQSLSFATYQQRRSANTVMIAKYLRPDFLTVQSEPDTDARDCYRPELNTAATDVAMIAYIVGNLNSAGIPGLHTATKVGSGMGSWQADWQDYLGTPGAGTGLVGIAGLDDIDNHVFYLTGQGASGMALELYTSLQMIETAHAAGKTASIGQYWTLKSLIVGENNVDVRVRSMFDFWAPLDQQYLPIIFELANSGSLQFLSAINHGEFWTYEPYALLPCLPVYPASPPTENLTCDLTIQSLNFTSVGLALVAKQISATGAAYQAEINQFSQSH